MKELVEPNDDEARAELDAMRFKVLDGAHRVRAIRSLMKYPSVLLFDSETRITVEVARETRSVVHRSLDVAAENAKNTREFAKKTFNDDLWAMMESKRRLPGGLLFSVQPLLSSLMRKWFMILTRLPGKGRRARAGR
jgi:hypothetical protein